MIEGGQHLYAHTGERQIHGTGIERNNVAYSPSTASKIYLGDATPIFFKNGSTDRLRPRNFSIETATLREPPGS
jgi:hypothetical protein